MKRENHRNRDLKNTYLWISREEQYGEDYEEKLLYKRQIPGLLSYYEAGEAGKAGLIYGLNGKKSWIESLGNMRMSCDQIEKFIYSLVEVMESVDEYLLDPSNLVVEMDYIFGNGEKWEFVYIPGYGVDFWSQMEKLGEEWLNWVDYEDERAVLWAYTFYKKVHEAFCSVSDLLAVIRMEKEEPVSREIYSEPEERQYVMTEKKSKVETGGIMNKLSMRWKMVREEAIDYMSHISKKKEHKKIEDDFFKEVRGMEDTQQLKKKVNRVDEEIVLLIPVGENDQDVIRVSHFPAIIGRAVEDADICLSSPKVSRLHARIDRKGRDMIIVDMNSSNGTYWNEERMKAGQAYVLHTGDSIRIADREYVYQ